MILKSDITARKLLQKNTFSQYKDREEFFWWTLSTCAKTNSHFKLRRIVYDKHHQSFSLSYEASYLGTLTVGKKLMRFSNPDYTRFSFNYNSLSKSLLIEMLSVLKPKKNTPPSNVHYDFETDTFFIDGARSRLFKDRVLCVEVSQVSDKDIHKQVSYLPRVKGFGFKFVDYERKTDETAIIESLKGTKKSDYPFESKILTYDRFVELSNKKHDHLDFAGMLQGRWPNWRYQKNGLDIINTNVFKKEDT